MPKPRSPVDFIDDVRAKRQAKTNVIMPVIPNNAVNSMPQNVSFSDMMHQFGENQNKNETVEVIKELFDHNKIKKISDVSPDARSLLIILNTISDLKGIPLFKDIADQYIELQLSLNRKSRKEVIEAIKMHQMGQQQDLGNKMRSVFQR